MLLLTLKAGWGLFTTGFVRQGELLTEYLGETVSQEEADRRGKIYDKHNLSYLFNVDSETVIDACPKGGKAKVRFPSAYACQLACVRVEAGVI